MDARNYIQSFVPTVEAGPGGETNASLSGNFELYLSELYCAGNLEMIPQGIDPDFEETNRSFRQGATALAEEVGVFPTRKTGNERGSGKIQIVARRPSSASETREEIGNDIEKHAAAITNRGLLLGAIMLSGAVQKYGTKAARKPAKQQESGAWAAKGIIGESRRNIVHALDPLIAAVTIRESYLDMHRVGLEVTGERSGLARYIPEWLKESTEIDQPVHRMCAAFTELDAYACLMEWVSLRGMPFVPVFTPAAMENGHQTRNSLNRRSDLLLCSLVSCELVPIQVKNMFNKAVVDEYDLDNILVVSTRELGQIHARQAIVADRNGSKRTGRVVETVHGGLMSKWASVYRNNPTHGAKRQLHEDMAAAFDYFDENIAMPQAAAA